MNAPVKSFVDSALLTLSEELFLLPAVAIAELLFYDKNAQLSSPSNQVGSALLGFYPWRELTLPLVSLNLERLDVHAIPHPKIAIINAQLGDERSPFFAVVFENKPHKLRVRSNELSWLDKKYRKALLKTQTEAFEVTLFDLPYYTEEVEKLLPGCRA